MSASMSGEAALASADDLEEQTNSPAFYRPFLKHNSKQHLTRSFISLLGCFYCSLISVLVISLFSAVFTGHVID